MRFRPLLFDMERLRTVSSMMNLRCLGVWLGEMFHNARVEEFCRHLKIFHGVVSKPLRWNIKSPVSSRTQSGLIGGWLLALILSGLPGVRENSLILVFPCNFTHVLDP